MGAAAVATVAAVFVMLHRNKIKFKYIHWIEFSMRGKATVKMLMMMKMILILCSEAFPSSKKLKIHLKEESAEENLFFYV